MSSCSAPPDIIVKYESQREPLKIILDNVHGSIKLSPLCVQVINTPTFQRLRNLKQLGVAHYVYPGATHTRFEHSIGTYHLARQWFHKLSKGRKEQLGVTRRERECVSIAGLVHDLGHGPFSHEFDAKVMPRLRPDSHWTHEKASVILFDHLLTEIEEVEGGEGQSESLGDKIGTNDARLIKALVTGKPDTAAEEDRDKKWMFDIVANNRNGVDVDKFDYLARDSLNTGIVCGFRACDRLMELSRVIDNEVCFKDNEAHSLYGLFHARSHMHRQVYSHKVGRAIELMTVDALCLADSEFGIAQAAEELSHDPRAFLQLDDTILARVATTKTTNPSTLAAQQIINRLQRRNIYKLADRINITALHHADVHWQNVAIVPQNKEASGQNLVQLSVDQIMAHKSKEATFTSQDIALDLVSVDYAMSDKDPVSQIRFFSRWSDEKSFTMQRDDVSSMLPQRFQEQQLRVYCRKTGQEGYLQEAFRLALADEMGSEIANQVVQRAMTMPVPSSPLKRLQAYSAPRRSAQSTKRAKHIG